MDGGWVDLERCTNAVATVNGTGKCLIPGLIESHLHLTDVQSLEYLTAYGVTTAHHMNCENYTQCHINSNQPGLADFRWAGHSAYVEYQFNNGSTYHKITAEVLGPSDKQQIEMVRTAHEQYGRQTMTHASDIHAYNQAVLSNTDGIQLLPDDGLLSNETISQILAQGQYVTPTLNVFEFAYRSPTLKKYFAVAPGSNRSLTHAETNAQSLYNAGVPLIAGTDSVGVLNMDGNSVVVPWGLTLHYELQNFVKILGMAPAEALNAATREAAKWHRIPDRGTIAAQKRADLVMLGSDPLVNITNTLDIEKIWVGGREVDRLPIPANLTVPNPTFEAV